MPHGIFFCMADRFSDKLYARTGLTKSGLFAALAVVAFMAMMLSKPDFYLDSARRGLALYATSVLPALFPFYFCSLLLTKTGAARTFAQIFGTPFNKLYGTPKESAYIMLMSMLSGYPVGAGLTYELYRAGAIDRDDAKAICSFASTSGPVFMLGTVGSAIFGRVEIGAAVLAAHYLSAFINGFIFTIKTRRKAKQNLQKATNNNAVTLLSREKFDNAMSESISKATLNMLYVGGYIVLCGMIADSVKLINLDALMVSSLGESAAAPLIAAIYGVIEMTRGCMASAALESLPIAVAMCAAIVSLGGLSVTLQNYTFLSGCGIKFREIVIRKLSQCLISLLIGYVLGAILA